MESKDIIIAIIGIIGSLIVTVLFNLIINLETTTLFFSLIGLNTILILIATYYLYKRLKEAEQNISKHEIEEKRLEEKLKIHEQLIDIKADIKSLQKGVTENEKRR